MRRFLISYLCVLCGVAGLSAWLMWRSYAFARADSVAHALSEQIQSGPGNTVDFAQIAPFAWDRVHFFGPYTSAEHIDTCLGFHWSGARWTSIRDSKGSNLIVFVKESKVVCWFEYPRYKGELEALRNPKGYTRTEARFQVQVHTLGSNHRLGLGRVEK